MVFDSEGVLYDDAGAELARVEIAPDPAYARLTIGHDGYDILKPKPIGHHFQLRDADSQLVYDFHPGLREGGTIRSPAGEDLAELGKHLVGFHWRITPAGGEPIEVKRKTGLAGSVLVDGHTAPPALDLTVPAAMPVGAEEARLLAFACWLIEQWEVQIV